MKNKFKTASVITLILSISIIAVWVVQTMIAYQNYIKHPELSAPFWAYQIPEVTAYGIPVIVGLILTVMFKRKGK
ncbi:hypothetical protein ACPUYX_03630 [Desulfosporosinus sp. SYSU MS00001]|uniref:hypothetical protein n=1 Tax=Desulfosporosinus sp. SYSU MS00001 TaxID=3416284 RepID=UPI003CF884AE